MGYRFLLSLVLSCAPVVGFAANASELASFAGVGGELSEIQFASEKSMSEYWQDVGLPYKLIESIVSEKICYNAEANFFGCVHAIDMVMAASGKKASLVTAKQVASGEEPGKLIKDFGDFKIVAAKPAKEGDVLELFEAAKKDRELNRLAWLAVFKDTGKKVPFEELVAFVKTGMPAAKESEVTAAAFNRFLATAKDPHTRITPRAFVDDEAKKTSSSFSGVGVTIRIMKKSLVIQKVTAGGPAAKAGVRANDIVVAVDGKDITGMEQEDALKLIKGPVGSKVTFNVLRKDKPLKLTMTRAEIVTKNVEFSMLKEENRNAMGYLKLSDFSRETSCQQMGEAVEKLESDGAKGLILDLRGNGGGRVNQALCIANLFIEQDKPVFSMVSLGLPQPPRVAKTADMAKTSLPMITLIDAYSASASELLSGALQDHLRSYIAGVRSFGKGTAQSVVPWKVDPNIYMIATSSYFLLPSGRSNQLSGVLPDTRAVYASPEPTKEEMFATREEDLYFNALPPPGVKVKFVQQRPEAVAKLQSCSDKGLAKRRFADGVEAPQAPDYQLLTAQDSMNCLLN